ncbi:MAG TPA: phosphocholine cytidylyltransferase family protein [Alphaproteobacteria bacterium]|nr:phosphocholine cytidylyltransferase family protein [Alphaproteobacteria bacterium]
MLALMLAAGTGERLGPDRPHLPKALLRFGGQSLLARHVAILRHFGVARLVITKGYRAEMIDAELGALAVDGFAETVLNPDYCAGSLLSLWALRSHLQSGSELLLMDADVLYDHRLMAGLLGSAHANCFLLDRGFEPGDEPVKLGVCDGRLVDFERRLDTPCDYCGESVGFFRFSPELGIRLVDAMAGYVSAGRTDIWYEAAIRDVLRASPPGTFGWEDVTGLPWIEIDFPEDVERARRDILPRLQALPEEPR